MTELIIIKATSNFIKIIFLNKNKDDINTGTYIIPPRVAATAADTVKVAVAVNPPPVAVIVAVGLVNTFTEVGKDVVEQPAALVTVTVIVALDVTLMLDVVAPLDQR